jgi:hypothetical protein
MSTVYNLEPPTKGKVRSIAVRRCSARGWASPRPLLAGAAVRHPRRRAPRSALSAAPTHASAPALHQVVLKTTHGDVEVELWAKEAPKVSSLIRPGVCGLPRRSRSCASRAARAPEGRRSSSAAAAPAACLGASTPGEPCSARSAAAAAAGGCRAAHQQLR